MTCHICARPTCVDDCQPRQTAPAATPDTAYREAIEALMYVVEHPESNQNFALDAGRQALGGEAGVPAEVALRTALLSAKRTLVQLRCSFSRNTVAYQEASCAIDQCDRALEPCPLKDTGLSGQS